MGEERELARGNALADREWRGRDAPLARGK